MVKKIACKETKRLFNENDAEGLSTVTATTSNWMGRIVMTNVEKSMIAKKLNITQLGEYAIKTR